MNLENQSCPLCKTSGASEFYRDKTRDYFRCNSCRLVFVPSSQFLSKEEEKSRYDLHQNSPDDLEYRKFLSRLYDPLEKQLSPKSAGLDFGSGPGATLSVMFEESGHLVSLYDCYYAKDDAVFKSQYDFVTATEVLEHLYHPKQELDRIWSCLKPGGRLGIMTKLVIDRDAFSNWHYRMDDTHVCFFSRETFEWLANLWNAQLAFFGSDVMIFEKK